MEAVMTGDCTCIC